MASFVIERHGFITAPAYVNSLVTDLLANGFTLKFPIGPLTGTEVPPYRITLEAGTAVDPLATTQPWRITFDIIEVQTCFIYVGTPIQLTDDGDIAYDIQPISATGGSFLGPVDVVGAIGAQVGSNITGSSSSPAQIDRNTGMIDWTPATAGGSAINLDDNDIGFINRRRRTGSEDPGGLQTANSVPMSYRLTVSPRGIWFGMWEDAVSNSIPGFFNWVLVQRPVDRLTGSVITTGKAPLFCVNQVGENIWKFVVRESDMLRPSSRRIADADTDDSDGIMNSENQVGLSEDGKYVVTFPARLNTTRYRYPHELDLIATTSSDVVSQWSDVPIEVYGESEPRIYKAMMSNNTNNTGMRLLVLIEGGGVGV